MGLLVFLGSLGFVGLLSISDTRFCVSDFYISAAPLDLYGLLFRGDALEQDTGLLRFCGLAKLLSGDLLMMTRSRTTGFALSCWLANAFWISQFRWPRWSELGCSVNLASLAIGGLL